jgi:hypothetical protein
MTKIKGWKKFEGMSTDEALELANMLQNKGIIEYEQRWRPKIRVPSIDFEVIEKWGGCFYDNKDGTYRWEIADHKLVRPLLEKTVEHLHSYIRQQVDLSLKIFSETENGSSDAVIRAIRLAEMSRKIKP